jgi:hypothetical protein
MFPGLPYVNNFSVINKPFKSTLLDPFPFIKSLLFYVYKYTYILVSI